MNLLAGCSHLAVASTMGMGISDSSADLIWVVSTWVSSAVVGWTSSAVTGVVEPYITGIGSIHVTCLLLVLCLLPMRDQKTLLTKL